MLDRVLRAVVEELRTVSTLQKKRLSSSDLSELFSKSVDLKSGTADSSRKPQVTHLDRRNQWRKSSKFAQNFVEMRFVLVDDILESAMQWEVSLSLTCAIFLSLQLDGVQVVDML